MILVQCFNHWFNVARAAWCYSSRELSTLQNFCSSGVKPEVQSTGCSPGGRHPESGLGAST